MSTLSEITIYNCENGEYRKPRRYLVTLHPNSHTAEFLDLLKEKPVRRISREDAFQQLMKKLIPMSVGAEDCEATYRRQFRSPAEYQAWRRRQFFEEHEIRWSIVFYFSDGSLRLFLCTSDIYCPEVFDEVESYLRQYSRYEKGASA